MEKDTPKKLIKPSVSSTNIVAKKDFTIIQNDFYLEIKIGDDLSNIPVCYLENLKTENVI